MWASHIPIRLVSRPKLAGPGEHVGVQLPSGHVAHRTPEGNFLVSFEDFACGRPVRVLRNADLSQQAAITARVAATCNQPAQYRLSDNNCEHYATWLMDGAPESPQVAGLATLALVGAFAYALTATT